jgi:hypothetical protein
VWCLVLVTYTQIYANLGENAYLLHQLYIHIILEFQTWCSGSAGWNVPSCWIWVVTMLLLDLVCSCSLLTEAILDSSVPLTKIIDLSECKYSIVQYLALGMWLNMKEYHKKLQQCNWHHTPPTCTDYPHQDLDHTPAWDHGLTKKYQGVPWNQLAVDHTQPALY